MSGNTFGAELYSDGKQIAPMLPIYPTITQCPECGTLFRLKDSNQIGESDPWKDVKTESGDDITVAKHLSIKGNLEAIEQEFYDENMGEVDYRINIWYLFNDRVRKGMPLFKNDGDEIIWQENLYKLLDLLDEDDSNRMIMVAEIHRNLGNFDECLSIIESLASPKMDWLTEKFKTECNNQNTLVFQLV
jgi:hypothetical protein